MINSIEIEDIGVLKKKNVVLLNKLQHLDMRFKELIDKI
jgi:hypothetical protein